MTAVKHFAETVDTMRVLLADGGSLRDLVEQIVERSGLVQSLEAERTIEAEGRIENIQEFFGVVEEFSAIHEDASLADFMEWVALRTDIDSMAEGERAVTLMTVHTAKGLEFPIVFMVGMEDTIFPHANSMFEESGLEEERRLAYVGITRARERLYLTHAHSRSLFGSMQYNPPSRFIGEIPEKHIEASGLGSQGITGTGFAARGEGSRGSGFGTGSSSLGRGGSGFRSGNADGRVFGGGAPNAPKKPPQPAETFEVGAVVEHKVFGLGTVKAVNGDKLEVAFQTAGTKNLLAGYAPLRRVEG